MKSYDEKLQELKQEVKDIDTQLVFLLNQRADFMTEINNLKRQNGIPTYDKLEEIEIMEQLEPISNYTNMINTIYPSILKYAKSLYEE